MITEKQQEISKHRLGLGLSGGGLRASFYHIGVLAQMAEQGLLPHLEVISTVSGGSIIGALYYLHVKKLLESKVDIGVNDPNFPAITNQDYIDIVKTIETDFLIATEKNIRMSVFSNVCANFKMVKLHYSSSDRIGELYNEWLYQPVLKKVSTPVQMQELKIYPPGQSNFHPNRDNQARKAKVPILAINATTLNTGRNWEFTAQTMGEPPIPPQFTRIDKKPIRLRRADGYPSMAMKPVDQQTFPLSHAVAASACVPALFDPMAVSNLYLDKLYCEKKLNTPDIRVQLVDGGVHDNQGIEGLVRNGCTCFVVSDAAGQMGLENTPATGPVGVLLRVSDVLQDRVRTEGLQNLLSTHHKNNVAFVNLREGLGIRQIAWVDEKNKQDADDTTTFPDTSLTFGVDPVVQDSLSAMRTDLDAFTEVEAYSLMFDGYSTSKNELAQLKNNIQLPNIDSSLTLSPNGWKFLEIADSAKNPSDDYKNQLKVAQSTFGKALMLMPWLWIPIITVVGVLLYFFGQQIWILLKTSSIPVSAILVIVVPWLLNIFAPKLVKLLPFLKLARPWATMAKAALLAVLLTIGTLFIFFYLKVINPLYLWRGRIKNLDLTFSQRLCNFWGWAKSGFK